MKKRSLVAAIAMLIVSALVLTTATYAWFASSNKAVQSAISTTISNSDGSIRLSADGGSTYQFNIAETDFVTTGDNKTLLKASALSPVSMQLVEEESVVTPKFMGGSLSKAAAADLHNTYTSSTATAGSQYTTYNFLVKADVDMSVNVKPTLASTVDYAYAMVKIDGNATYYIYSAGTGTYYPITFSTSTVSAMDTDDDSIIDADDTVHTIIANQAVTKTANASSIPLTLTANSAVKITVWYWAEGQDPACYGSADSSISVNIDIEKATT